MREQRRILRPQQRAVFSVNHGSLKIIGLVCTLAGAWAAAAYQSDDISTVRMLLMLISYIALPIYAFLAVEGVAHTSNMGKYLLRTLIAFAVAEPFYDYVRQGTLLEAQNVLLSILVAQVMLYYLMKIQVGKLWGVALKVLLVAAALFWAVFLQGQYGAVIVLMAAIFYFFRDKKLIRTIGMTVLSVATYFSPVLALIFINAYDGEPPKYNKYFFYVVFPLIWVAFAAMKLFLM